MGGLGAALLVVATVSPAVGALRLPDISRRMLWLGVGASLAAGSVLLAVADPLAEALRVEPESFTIAAGLVLGATGLARLVIPVGRREEVVTDPWGFLVPVTYPVIVGPELVLALLAVGVGDDPWAGWLGLAAGLVLAGLATAANGPPLVLRGIARLTAAVQVLLGVALTIDGIRSV